MLFSPLPFLFVIAGCTPLVDLDEDGFFELQDCDDERDDVNPGLGESCDGIDNDCNGLVDDNPMDGETFYLDVDGDGLAGEGSITITACEAAPGWVAVRGDCNDLNANSFPDADEICDGEDNDCDGGLDEDAIDTVTFYADADGDGFGDSVVGIEACDEPDGYVKDSTDCDDADSTQYPSASELCDEVDNDCDGQTDEEMPTYYYDGDSDGFGDAGNSIQSCDPDELYITDSSDCDDSASDVFPAAPELCDGVDNDCDGQTDEEPPVWYADTDGDGYGDPAAASSACAAPADHVANNEDCDDTTALAYPGAPELCDSLDNNCDGTADETPPIWYADTDGDGYGDPDSTENNCNQPTDYVGNDDDCDDGNTDANPAGTETCGNAQDEDCDGLVDGADPDVTLDPWFADMDGDTFGAISSGLVLSCSDPGAPYVQNASDCDDSDIDVRPDATEICNEVDDDCDGAIDVADSSVTGAQTVYFDADLDGHGNAAAVAQTFCTTPDQYAATKDDCDDLDGTVYPGASELRDMIDNDCDGVCDEGFIAAGDVIVTEVLGYTNWIAPFFEIYNNTNSDIPLCDGWSFQNQSGSSFVLNASNTVLRANTHYVLTGDDNPTSNGGYLADYEWSGFGVSGSGSIRILFDGNEIDSGSYDWTANPDRAAQLSADAYGASQNDNSSNWCESSIQAAIVDTGTHEYWATPGSMNAFCAGSGSGS